MEIEETDISRIPFLGSIPFVRKERFFQDGEYTVGQEANDGRTSYYNSYDKNKTLKSVEYSKATDSSTRSKMIKFYNGVAYSIEERKLSLEPKLTADKLIDKSQFEPTAPSGIAAVDKQHLLAEVLVNEDIEKNEALQLAKFNVKAKNMGKDKKSRFDNS